MSDYFWLNDEQFRRLAPLLPTDNRPYLEPENLVGTPSDRFWFTLNEPLQSFLRFLSARVTGTVTAANLSLCRGFDSLRTEMDYVGIAVINGTWLSGDIVGVYRCRKQQEQDGYFVQSSLHFILGSPYDAKDRVHPISPT
jgi:hypothetical protein